MSWTIAKTPTQDSPIGANLMFAFWVESLLFPITLLLINALARWSAGMPQSAPGDLILLFGIFDAAVILRAEDLVQISDSLESANSLRAYFLVVGAINAALWAFAVFRVERGLHAGEGWFGRSTFRGLFGYFAVTLVAIVLNTAPFTVRGHS